MIFADIPREEQQAFSKGQTWLVEDLRDGVSRQKKEAEQLEPKTTVLEWSQFDVSLLDI